jgi:lysophospholipase L1-like esterase
MSIARERIEWCNIWIPQADEAALPRVLLIGDSITQGLYDDTAARLDGTAYVARLTTSRFLADPVFLQEFALVLGQYPWAVIVVNNGLHGFAYPEEAYAAGLPRLIAFLREAAPAARLVWAQSTRILVTATEAGRPDNDRVVARNAIARAVMTGLDVPVVDRYALVEPHPEWLSPDHVHFLEDGNRALGEQTAEAVKQHLRNLV